MLMIIAHHYVVNSGITELYNFSQVSGNQMFLELLGWGGKTGINCFLLITGYFMCKQDFTWRKFLKLYLEVKFYTLLLPLLRHRHNGEKSFNKNVLGHYSGSLHTWGPHLHLLSWLYSC